MQPHPGRSKLATPMLAILLGLGLGLASLAMRVVHLGHREVSLDEFEHTHAAFLVAQGQRPYVDFFEHHPPLFYLLGAAVVTATPRGIGTILDLRVPGFAAWLLAALATVLLVQRTWGRLEAIATGVLLLADVLLFEFGSLVYLDTFAAPFVALSALALTGRRCRRRHAFLATLSLGIAVLFTQKALLAVPALLFAMGSGALRERRDGGAVPPASLRAALARVLAGSLAGAAVCAGGLALALGSDGLQQFWEQVWTLNLHWRARHFPWATLGFLVRRDAFTTVLAATGLLLAGRESWRRRLRPDPRDVPAAYAAALLLGIFVLPVVWEEYFVVLAPFLCALAGPTLVAGLRTLGARTERWDWRPCLRSFAVLGILAGHALAFAAAARSVKGGWEPRLSWALVLALSAWLALGVHLLASAHRRVAPQWSALVLPALLFALVNQAIMLSVDFAPAGAAGKPPLDEQRDRVAFVMHETAPDQPYFDGYSGYGVFRPHAYRYWFLHDEVQAMLGKQDLAADVIAALEQKEPPLVTVDGWTRTLSPAVLAFLEQHYEPTAFGDIWRRRVPAAPAVDTSSKR